MRRRAFVLASMVLACACAERAPEEPIHETSAAIVKGTPSDDAQNGVVLVMHYDALAKGGGAASGCTGSLLAPTLVLTARHCVADTDSGAACNSQGKPVAGGEVQGDHDPKGIYVFGGKERPDYFSGNLNPAKGVEILTTGAKTLCDNDIALIVLDRPVAGATIVPIRLDAKPAKGEIVTVVGWGIADDDPNPDERRQRTNVEIVDVGPGEQLGPAEFRIGEGTCQGDSGGPAIAESGAVLGALSRGGNGTDDTGADACLGGTNIFSSVAAHAAFIRSGYEKVGQEPWLEGAPNPLLAKIGGSCAADAECQSSTCSDAKVCAQDCSQAACEAGFVCTAQASRKVCVAASSPPPDESCTVGHLSGQASGLSEARPRVFLGGVVACALAVLFRRARSEKRRRNG